MKNIDNNGIDFRMCILSVIAICFVVMGHILNDEYSLGTFYGWFPYYSFHLPIFLFISGYFYKEPVNDSTFLKYFGRFIVKKIKSLMIPYYVILGLFMLLNNLLIRQGFEMLDGFSLLDWMVSPWIRLAERTYAMPIWYLPALFLAEVFFVVIRKVVGAAVKNDLVKEITAAVLTFILGVAALCVKSKFLIPDVAYVYLRSVIMVFFIQLGLLYRKYLEKIDKIPSVWYFAILFALQFVMISVLNPAALFPGLQMLSNMGRFGIGIYAGGITGIALWLRAAGLLSTMKGRSRLVLFIGRNTKYIMAFHLLGFLLLNFAIRALTPSDFGLMAGIKFNDIGFKTQIYYTVGGSPRLYILYFIAGMAAALLIAWILEKLKYRITRKKISGSSEVTCTRHNNCCSH